MRDYPDDSRGKYLEGPLAEKIADRLKTDSDLPLHQPLSRREHEIMCMIAVGKSQAEIAQELSLSENTVKTYRKQILDKMHMEKNAEIIRYALINGLVK